MFNPSICNRAFIKSPTTDYLYNYLYLDDPIKVIKEENLKIMIWRFSIVFAFTICVYTEGQCTSVDSIAQYASQLLKDSVLENRERAFQYLNAHLGDLLRDSFADPAQTFPELEGLSVIRDAKSKVRLITYQLYADTSDYRYGGWLQSTRIPSPVFLTDRSRDWEKDPDLPYMEFSPEQWYGMLYYQIIPVRDSPSESVFAVFGFDNYHFFTKRKMVDFVVIGKEGVRFGKPLVEMEADLPEEYRRYRFILDYAVQAPATLRYDASLQKVVFDHLIFMKSEFTAQKIMRVPDGTYSGFEITETGIFKFIEKLFHETLDEAPDGRKETVDKDLDPILGDSGALQKKGTKSRDKN